MNVHVEYNNYSLREVTHKENEEITFEKTPHTVEELFHTLQKQYGKKFKNLIIDSQSKVFKVSVLINGRGIKDIHYPLKNGDKINLMVISAGG